MTIRTQLIKRKSHISSRASTSGFTLVEFLVALAIVLMMIIAASGIEARYLKMASQVKHEVVAQDLAEQCMNNIRKQRDTNLLGTAGVFDGLGSVACPDITLNGVLYHTIITVEDI